MIKGGYTSFDLSTATSSEDPVTIAGIYQKCKDTIGKLAICTLTDTGFANWGCIQVADGGFVICTQLFDGETGYYPALYEISNEDAVACTIMVPDDGEG